MADPLEAIDQILDAFPDPAADSLQELWNYQNIQDVPNLDQICTRIKNMTISQLQHLMDDHLSRFHMRDNATSTTTQPGFLDGARALWQSASKAIGANDGPPDLRLEQYRYILDTDPQSLTTENATEIAVNVLLRNIGNSDASFMVKLVAQEDSTADLSSVPDAGTIQRGEELPLAFTLHFQEQVPRNFDEFFVVEVPNGYRILAVVSGRELPTIFGLTPHRLPCSNVNIFERDCSIPDILVKLYEQMQLANGLEEEGIFRLSPSASALQKAREGIDNNQWEDVKNDIDSICSAALIKAWFRELPERVLAPISINSFLEVASLEDFTLLLEQQLSDMSWNLMLWMIHMFACVVLKSDSNCMSALGCATLMLPNLLTEANSDITALELLRCTQHLTPYFGNWIEEKANEMNPTNV